MKIKLYRRTSKLSSESEMTLPSSAALHWTPTFLLSIPRCTSSAHLICCLRRLRFDDRNGNVTLFLQGASTPGANGNFTVTPPSRRGFFSKVGDKIKDGVDDVKSDVEDGVDDIKDAAHDVVSDAKGLVQHTIHGMLHA